MRIFPREFPHRRLRKPTRRAERRIFGSLATSDLAGFTYYEWRREYEDGEVDFALWVASLGRAALQVKGGHYELQEGEFSLHTRDGLIRVASSPIDEAWLGALDLHDDIVDRLAPAYDPFVVPILAFPDMDPDEAIEKLARRKRVNLLWRSDTPSEAVAEILRSQPVLKPLPWSRIRCEVEAITDGLIILDEGQPGDVVDASGCPAISDACREAPASTSKILRINVAGAPLLAARTRDIIVRHVAKR